MIFQLLWYYYSNIWPFWQCIEERDEGKKAKEKQGKKEVKNDFHSCTTNFSLEKTFSFYFAAKGSRAPVYLLCNFPAENDVFENCKEKTWVMVLLSSRPGSKPSVLRKCIGIHSGFFFLLGQKNESFLLCFPLEKTYFHHLHTIKGERMGVQWDFGFFVKAG